jgi:hypothetical protein
MENRYGSQDEKPVGGEGQDRLDPPAERTSHKESACHRTSPSFKESVAEGTAIRDAHADVLPQPRRKGIERIAPC